MKKARAARPTPVTKEKALAVIAAILKRNQKMTALQKRVIDTVASELPEKFFDATTLSHWYGNVALLILRILAKDDKRLLSILNEVYKEIVYLMHADVFDKLKLIIKSEKPEYVSLAWINTVKKQLPVQSFYMQYRTDEGEIDWDFIVSRLGAEDKFIHREKPELRLKKVIEKLIAFLENEKPSYFNPVWIESKSYKDYKFITYNFSWNEFKEKLPEQWREYFVFIEHKIYTLEDVRNKLVSLLEKEQPVIFRPDWIRKKDFNMWLVLRNRLIGHYGDNAYPDWNIIISILPQKWQEKWKFRGVIESAKVPDLTHKNYSEIENLHKKYGDSVALFYFSSQQYLTVKEKDVLEDIVLELRVMAKNGNLIANDALITHLSALADRWIAQSKELAVWDRHLKKMENLIQQCVYKYEQGKYGEKKLFINYLEKSLKAGANNLKDARYVESFREGKTYSGKK